MIHEERKERKEAREVLVRKKVKRRRLVKEPKILFLSMDITTKDQPLTTTKILVVQIQGVGTGVRASEAATRRSLIMLIKKGERCIVSTNRPMVRKLMVRITELTAPKCLRMIKIE